MKFYTPTIGCSFLVVWNTCRVLGQCNTELWVLPLFIMKANCVSVSHSFYIEEAFSSRNTQKKNFLSPQRESNPWPSRYRLDTLTTELWETRGEQGHILGSYMCDMCPAILPYKNPVYDLAHHESPIAQWLELEIKKLSVNRKTGFPLF